MYKLIMNESDYPNRAEKTKCKECNEFLPSTKEYFYHKDLNRDKLIIICRDCKQKRTNSINKPKHKKCSICGKVKLFNDEIFCIDMTNDTNYGLKSYCRECRYERKRKPSFQMKHLIALPPEDEAIMTPDGISVLCTYGECRKRFHPDRWMIDSRLSAIKYDCSSGSSFFYCCDQCKDDCPLYGYNINTIFPLSDLYVAPSDKQKARSCQGSSKKGIMDIQMDEFGYHYCEVCGTKHDRLNDMPMELHHTNEVAKCGLKAINSAGHMITCYDCHKKITKGILST